MKPRNARAPKLRSPAGVRRVVSTRETAPATKRSSPPPSQSSVRIIRAKRPASLVSKVTAAAKTTKATTMGGDDRWILRIALLVLLAVGAAFIADRLYDPQQFRFRDLEVHGELNRVSGEQVQRAVQQSLSGNYFSLDLRALENRIAEIPWVFRATVRRRWPGTLVIRVMEVKPVADWGDSHWVNFNGALIVKQPKHDLTNLPRLFAARAHRELVWSTFNRWVEMFAAQNLHLRELQFDPRGIWRLQLSANANNEKAAMVKVTVSQQHAESRIGRLLRALPQQLRLEFADIRSIDLRYPNGFAVSWKGRAPAEQSVPKKSTEQPAEQPQPAQAAATENFNPVELGEQAMLNAARFAQADAMSTNLN